MARQYEPPPPLTDEDYMPSGKYKDEVKMKDLPAKYLLYIYENEMCGKRVKAYIEENLDVIQRQAKSNR